MFEETANNLTLDQNENLSYLFANSELSKVNLYNAGPLKKTLTLKYLVI